MEPWLKWVLIILVVLVLATCCCVAVAAIAGYFAFDWFDDSGLDPNVQETAEMIVDPVSSNAKNTLELLDSSHVPENDLFELAERLLGQQDIPLVLDTPPVAYQLGDAETFWATEMESNENFEIDARLEYITPHAYFWIEQGLSFENDALAKLADTFENEIYPQTRAVFGNEWSPGIDNDVHLYILYGRGMGSNIAGYFSSRDSVHVRAYKYSNMHEMFFFNADTVELDDEYTFGVLAHEFQHMIQWNVDRNESTWMNEGLSELSTYLNGYDAGGFDLLFMLNPDRQLTYWPDDPNATSASYGASFLFMDYFYSRFGENLTKQLVANNENGLESIDLVLAEAGLPENADDLFQDWVITNYLHDGSVGDGRYTYDNYPNAPAAKDTETIDDCDGSLLQRAVHQYGTDYISLTCPGIVQLMFEGSTEVGVLPVDAHSGEQMWWSNKGDESDMTLTHQFDLTGVTGDVLLEYWAWYDIEKDYDYLYVETSLDGETWEIVTTPRGSDKDPSGNSYGWAYNGESEGWVQEQVDLGRFAGQKVWVRFEYITDAAVNGEGFALDDMQLTAIGYEQDFETGDGGWEAAGFVRVSNNIPQTYAITLVTITGDDTTVERLELDDMNRWRGNVEIGSDVEKMVLMVSGLARFTNQPVGYNLILTPQ